MRVSGFTIVRNAIQLDYPFVESVESVLPLCDEFVINCGDSTDDTVSLCETLAKRHSKIKLIRSTWSQKDQKGGFQLKHQTDVALKACTGEWCLYIQADEVMHEADFPLIREAMKKADGRSEIDGLVFNYLHFYGNYDHEIRGRNWYRREVRLFKNHRGISAFRDAQGFRKADGGKVVALHSGARVFHYGYVRSVPSLKQKAGEMARWWGEKAPTQESAYQLKRHVGLRRYTQTHPAVMKSRLEQNAICFNPETCPREWNKDEIKNAITLIWESIVPYRIGEFKNYELK